MGRHTHVEFRSANFPANPGEEEKINPGRWGQRLAEYLQEKLKARGFSLEDEVGFEDWGCRLTLRDSPFPMWIGCGNYDEYPDGHLCFIEPSTPTIRKFFKKLDTTAEVARLADALNSILIADPQIRDVRWWEENEK
jgi:hypothetical protein